MDFDRITTRGGDRGETSIADGSRRPKDDLLIETLGEVDELHAALGLLRAALADSGPESTAALEAVIHAEETLIRIGGQIAVPPSDPRYGKMDLVDDGDIEALEKSEAALMKNLNLPPRFVTYGSCEIGARADLARAICRRAERRLVSLIRSRGMTDLAPAQRWINRLSDWLFILARREDSSAD